MLKLELNCGPGVFFIAFWLSGFSALMYESVWTHYIKLFLGHAAYAQTLVLVVFMGGLALGSWIASRRSVQWKNLLRAYAGVEGLIGIAALLFHKTFVSATDFTYDHLLPAVQTVVVAHGIKWGLAAAFVLPQSILLGMTFPLMSGGIIRRFPSTPGASLSMLYFSNSFGAALGVLFSGFVLIARVGLPGTMFTAGLINVMLALVIWLLTTHEIESAPDAVALQRQAGRLSAIGTVMLGAAFVTGAASFLYEIAWIRGLSMVLGGSTHSFELMLSAFILGLGLGALWIRRRIDLLQSPAHLLGYLQIAMGLFALATLPLFSGVFEFMQYIVEAISHTDQGYRLYHVFLHALCLLVMLPATFCAGTTLPLMTHLLLRRGEGERAIGAVYAANTLGAIVGVILAIHLLMPWVGVKGVLWVGAALDMALGVFLLCGDGAHQRRFRFAVPVFATTAALMVAALFAHLDPKHMLSGVFRGAPAKLSDDSQVLFLRDGKTATIGLVRYPSGLVTISTNGKIDAALYVEGSNSSQDEATMIVAGALGLALHPGARSAANIGFGSGLTTHVMLSTPQLERLDTVEMEPYMVEAAKGYGARVERAFTDPRSHIHIEDAKTFFSSHRQRYDVIVSEPSNPWVSGVASLFSHEFYARVGDYLQPDGLFLQWVQLYETEPTVIASIVKALSAHFSDYVIYNTDDTNMIIVARKQGQVGMLDPNVVAQPGLATELRRIHISSAADLQVRRIGTKRTLDPMFQSFDVPSNSDYFPFVDLAADRARFIERAKAVPLFGLTVQPLPMLEMLDPIAQSVPAGLDALSTSPLRTRLIADARALRQSLLDDRYGDAPRTIRPTALLPQLLLRACDEARSREAWIDSLIDLAAAVNPHLSPDELESVWHKLERERCFFRLVGQQREWFGLVRAVSRRDATSMATLSERILEFPETVRNPSRVRYAVMSGMLGYIVKGEPDQALSLWAKFGSNVIPIDSPTLEARFLLSLASPEGDRRRVAAAR